MYCKRYLNKEGEVHEKEDHNSSNYNRDNFAGNCGDIHSGADADADIISEYFFM